MDGWACSWVCVSVLERSRMSVFVPVHSSECLCVSVCVCAPLCIAIILYLPVLTNINYSLDASAEL